MFKYLDVQMSTIQIFKCSDAQMFKCSNVQIIKCSNVQMSNVNKVKLLPERTFGVSLVIFWNWYWTRNWYLSGKWHWISNVTTKYWPSTGAGYVRQGKSRSSFKISRSPQQSEESCKKLGKRWKKWGTLESKSLRNIEKIWRRKNLIKKVLETLTLGITW